MREGTLSAECLSRVDVLPALKERLYKLPAEPAASKGDVSVAGPSAGNSRKRRATEAEGDAQARQKLTSDSSEPDTWNKHLDGLISWYRRYKRLPGKSSHLPDDAE